MGIYKLHKIIKNTSLICTFVFGTSFFAGCILKTIFEASQRPNAAEACVITAGVSAIIGGLSMAFLIAEDRREQKELDRQELQKNKPSLQEYLGEKKDDDTMTK